jgi:hypothetical protein
MTTLLRIDGRLMTFKDLFFEAVAERLREEGREVEVIHAKGPRDNVVNLRHEGDRQ